MKYLLLFLLFAFISCINNENIDEGQESGIFLNTTIEREQTSMCHKIRIDCHNLSVECQDIEIPYALGERKVTKLELNKFHNCDSNISALSCDSEAVVNHDLSLVPDCLFYENTEGFPDWKGECERFMTGVCEVPRNCVNGVQCDPYQGEKPFREGCEEAENNEGAYTCTGDYNNVPFCKPFWVEYKSGCHDFPGYVKKDSFKDFCAHVGDTLLMDDNSIFDKIDVCKYAISGNVDVEPTCSDYYTIDYDLASIPECQFLIPSEE